MKNECRIKIQKVLAIPLFLMLALSSCGSGQAVPKEGGTGINLKGFEKTGVNTFKKEVENKVDTFDFTKVVTVAMSSTWYIYKDESLKESVDKKNAPCNEGNNDYYIAVSTADNEYSVYVASIYRLHLYTVCFDFQNGEQNYEANVEENSICKDIPSAFKQGYTFQGWDKDLTQPVTKSFTTKALYVGNYYNVVLDSNGGGTLDQNTFRIQFGAKCSFPSPEKEGYTFAGWYYNSTKVDETWSIASDVTLVAKWTPNQYTVSFYETKEDFEQSKLYTTKTYTFNERCVFPQINKNGLNFEGWSYNDQPLNITTYNIAKNIKVYGLWSSFYVDIKVEGNGKTNFYDEEVFANFYSDKNDSSPFAQQALYYGDTIRFPSLPTKQNYVLMGWTDKDDNEFDFNSEIKDSVNIYAKWYQCMSSSYYEETHVFDISKSNTFSGSFVQYHKADNVYFASYIDQSFNISLKKSSEITEMTVNVINAQTNETIITTTSSSRNMTIAFDGIKGHVYRLNISVNDTSAVYKNYTLNFGNNSFVPIFSGQFKGYQNKQNHTAGEVINLVAYDTNNFVGWFDSSNNLLSNNSRYSFSMRKENIIITARFN